MGASTTTGPIGAARPQPAGGPDDPSGDGVPADAAAPAAPDAAAPDLAAPADDVLADARVPDGWERVADVARRVAASLDTLTGRILDDVAAELPEYGDERVPRGDLEASVTRNLEMMLLGLAERRGPTPEELAVRRHLGARRAEQGLPVDTLIQAYHIGYRDLWDALVAAVPADDPGTATALLTGATTVWRWVHEVSSAISQAHGDVVRSHEARTSGIRRRLVELVASGDLGSDARALAVAAGLDPDGPTIATVARVGRALPTDPGELDVVLEEADGVHAWTQRGAAVLVLSQGEPPAQALLQRLPDAVVGIGLERTGLEGARRSLEDAGQVAALGAVGVHRFADEWVWATLARHRQRLGALLTAGADVASEHPHLAETVLAFADAGFSVTEAARTLDLHANTASYRLERWHQLTGWDVRSFDGLVRSVAAIRLSRGGEST
ncbi:MAG: PucR family transcriptional regulator [Actinomycetes bacterium]